MDALAAVLAGPPALVIVEGEAGIGKTRLVREFLASPSGRAHKVLVATCPPLRRPHTLGAVADALRAAVPDGLASLGLSPLADALRPLFPEWFADLPSPPDPAEDPSVARHMVFTALATLLARLGVDLLVTEDVHWADEATVEFLLSLASQQPRSLGLVVTCRPEDVPTGSLLPRLGRLAAGASSLRITLGALGMAATADLMSSMLAGAHVSGEFARFVHEHTDGVPLAVEELVRLLAARGDVFRRDGGWARHQVRYIGLPPAVRDVVLDRVARLTPDARAVLRAAAVLADPAGEATIAAVAGVAAGRARAGLGEALSCGLLCDDARRLVAFRHELAARAVYETIPGPERRAAHLRAGLVLEAAASQSAARLARHFREAGDTAKWSRYAELAADLAVAAGDETGATALLYDLVSGAGLAGRDLARLMPKLRFTSFTASAYQDLVHALRSVLDVGNLPPAEEADLRFQLGRTLIVMEEYEEARAELRRATRHLGHDPVAAARAMIMLGWPLGSAPRSEHLRWVRRAAGVSVPPTAPGQLALVVDRVTALLLLGEEEGWAQAARLPTEPPTPQDVQPVLAGLLNTAEAALTWGRFAEAESRLERALTLADQRGSLRMRDAALARRAHLDWFTCAWAGLAEKAGALAGDEDIEPVTRLGAVLVTGLLHAASGVPERAGECFQAVLAGMRRRGATEDAMGPAAALARLQLAAGDAEAALTVTEAPAGIIARKGTWIWAADLAPARAEALIAARRTGEAAELVAAFARGLRGRDAPAPKAGLALCRAILAEARGEHARAADMFARAAAAWHALPRPYDGLLARERQARCLLAEGDDGRGLKLLSEVQAGLSRLGATGDAGRLARALRERGVAAPRVRRGIAHSCGSQLSPREHEVVRLAAAGRTNREIAAALYRSPHTVGNQLKSAMRKLGVSSRALLAVPGFTPDRESHGTVSVHRPGSSDGRNR
jgi:DNA-binding CsgD family transcriptional regulator